MSNAVFCLMGPTASGKTALAVELVQRFPMEIISIDSAMIYRGMNIGSAKPDAELLKIAPHHLIDILDPTEAYSAAQSCADVKALCEDIIHHGNIPLLTGGTMMYFNAIQQGLSTLPCADEHIREMLMKQAGERGWAHMHAQLAEVDAISAARIHPNDTQRIQRALEVYLITKTPLSTLYQDMKSELPFQFMNLSLMPQERHWLHSRIAERFKGMLQAGLIDEVQELLRTWSLTEQNPSMRSVGYRQVLHYLQGVYDESILLEKGIAATRQLAKRQLTWLRHWPEKTELIAENPAIVGEVVALVTQMLDNI